MADSTENPPPVARWAPVARRSRFLALVLLVAACACLVYLTAERSLLAGELGFPLDDTWIHLQFARNLGGGEGLSYEPGELVTGSTAPLWTALLTLLLALPGGAVPWVKGLGVALHLAGVHAAFVMARELEVGDRLALLAALLTASTSWLVWSALSGLEIPLFVLLSSWGIILHLRGRKRRESSSLALAVLAVSALARPEGVLLVVLAVGDSLLSLRRKESGRLHLQPPRLPVLVAGLGLAALALAPVLAFNLLVGGSVLPTTFGAKAGGPTSWVPSLRYLHDVLPIFLRPQPVMVLFCGAGILRLVERLGGERDRGLLPAMWLLALPLAYSVLSPPGGAALAGNLGRYLFPLFPVLIVLGVLGLERSARSLGRRVVIARATVPLRLVLAALLVLPSLAALAGGARLYGRCVANVEESNVRAARWLSTRLSPQAVIAVNDIGALRFFLPNRVLDLAGIVNPEVRRYIHEETAAGRPWQQGILRFLADRRPDYLVVFPDWFPGMVGEGSPFELEEAFTVSHNVVMGGDVVAVYSTPWTRFPLVER